MVWEKSHTGINLQGTAERINSVPEEGHYEAFGRRLALAQSCLKRKTEQERGAFKPTPK